MAEAMAAINGRVAQMNELMDAIVAAGAEQSAGIGQVGQTIAQMERATQQNAALVAAAGSLSGQSERLAALVREFIPASRRAHREADTSFTFDERG